MTLLLEASPVLGALTDGLLADAAVRALIEEARLTPKPGLVDARGGGAHRDMSLELMLTSASALRETFRALAEAGRSGADDAGLRRELASIGRTGEAAMMTATGGVNTHRGAIWSLGLTVAATSARPGASAVDILAKVAAIAAHDDVGTAPAPTPGSRARARYRVGGAIAQARAGFPHAALALRALRLSRAAGHGETSARIDALLTSMRGLDDTCLLARGGLDGLARAQEAAAAILRAGGSGSPRGRQLLQELDCDLLSLRISPGGSADMLSVALFLDSIDPDLPKDR